MSYMETRLNDISREQGASSWLTVLPIKRLGFGLSKAEFWDAVRLRYGLPFKRLPSHCGCSSQFTVQLAAKREDFLHLDIMN